MVVKVLLCLFVLVTAAVGITDEQYYSMPRMFELDDYDECLGSRGAFCLGSFHLSSQKYSKLLDIIQEISKDKYKFNHTVISRGYCVTTTCAHVSGEFLPEVFEDCVQNITKSRYKLDAKLLTLEYCQTRNSPPQTPVDVYDMIFACVAGLILIGNAVGTAYDLLRNPDAKPNRYLMSWSLIENWKRLTATYEKGDPRYEPLTPVHGLKAITLILVMLAHSVIAHHMTYIHNPRFLEEKNIHPLSTVLHNGTSVVQTFIILSSFLLAYNVLHSLETDPKKKVNFRLWFAMVVHRIARILPLNVFVVGLCATWWRFASAGPLWALVGAESARCRRKWWAHALFVNNLVEPDERCLVQSWFLAVDMQLYILMSLVLVLLARRKHAVKILAGLFVATVVANFFIAYYLDLKSILFIAYPEYIRAQYAGVPSFKWQYAAAWGSAPAAALGLLLAALQRRVAGHALQGSAVFRVFYWLSVPANLLWILGGYFIRHSNSRFTVALYTALDRPVFCLLMSVTMIGLFFKVDLRVLWTRKSTPPWESPSPSRKQNKCPESRIIVSSPSLQTSDNPSLYRHILTWRAWQILGRMSLSVLLVHWSYNLTILAVKTNLARVSVYEIGGHLFASMFMTYVTSVPLYLMVEIPAQKTLQMLFSP